MFTRRDLLRLSAAGAFCGSAVSWLDIVAQRGLAQSAGTGKRHKSCIVLFCWGVTLPARFERA